MLRIESEGLDVVDFFARPSIIVPFVGSVVDMLGILSI